MTSGNAGCTLLSMTASTKTLATETLDLGNNERVTRGVVPQADGTYLALTFTQSRTFKTRAGAERWLLRTTGQA